MQVCMYVFGNFAHLATHLHLWIGGRCDATVAIKAHAVHVGKPALQVRIVAFHIVWAVVGIVVSWKEKYFKEN